MGNDLKIKLQQENESDIEFEIVPMNELLGINKYDNYEDLENIDKLIEDKQNIIDNYNKEIDSLTNKADKIDYTVAVGCGVLTGALDVLFVGEFDFEGSVEKINDKFSEFVSKKADSLKKMECENKIKKAIEEAKEKGDVSDEKAKKIAEKIRESYKKKGDIDAKISKAIEKAKQNGEKIDESKIKGKW